MSKKKNVKKPVEKAKDTKITDAQKAQEQEMMNKLPKDVQDKLKEIKGKLDIFPV